jgi:radical SAM protein with 4Fe4S-binding SPASM domain
MALTGAGADWQDYPMTFTRIPGRVLRLLFHAGRRRRLQSWLRYRAARRQIALAESDMREGRTVVRARPVYLILDPGPLCNLRCRFCHTAAGTGTLAKELLTPETFARLVPNLPLDSLFEANLFNWGEPLLNPHLNDYIRFFADRGIQVVIHANFSAQDYDEAHLEALVRSGLTHFVASVDGASQETYGAYRVGGDFERVIRNLGRLVQTRNRLGSQTPRISYKMILNRINQHELEEARRLAESLGAEFLLQEEFGMPEEFREEWTSDRVREKYGAVPVTSVDMSAKSPVSTECRQMWDTLVVNANGDVHACCQVHRPGCALGNLTRERFEEVWNNEKMQCLRKFVLDARAPTPDFDNWCATCPFRSCTFGKGRGG